MTSLSVFFESLKGGMNMLHTIEWSIVSVIFSLIICSWIKSGEERKGSLKRWMYRVVNPIALGVPAGVFAVTLLLGLHASLHTWILKWFLVLILIYAAARYYLESSNWLKEYEVVAKISIWGKGKGKRKAAVDLESPSFKLVPIWIWGLLKAKGTTVEKEFLLGALSKKEKDGRGLGRTLLAKIRLSFSFRLESLAKSVGRFKLEDLDQHVKNEFLATFRTVLRKYTLEGNLDKQDKIGKETLEALEKRGKLTEWGIKAESAYLLEMSVDDAIYRAQNELALMDMEDEEVYKKVEVGEKIKPNWAGTGAQNDIKGFVLKNRRIAKITSGSRDVDQKEEIVKEQKLEMITKKERAKVLIHLCLVGLIILMGIVPLGFIGWSKFGPAKAEMSMESVAAPANVAPPANPSGPSGTVDSPFSYPIPGFQENPMFWGVLAFLMAFLIYAGVAAISKKEPEWLKKHRWGVIGTCAMMFFFNIFAYALPDVQLGTIVMIISLFVAARILAMGSIRVLAGMMMVIFVLLFVVKLIIPGTIYMVDRKVYDEQIATGKLWEGTKKSIKDMFDKPETQASDEVFSQPSQPTVEPKIETPKEVTEFQPPKVEEPQTRVVEKAVSNVALRKPVVVVTNGTGDAVSHAGRSPSDITDGNLDYQPASYEVEDGCIGWVNSDYDEPMLITITIDLQATYNISKIRYNPGNCERAETWNADTIESPFGKASTNPGSPYRGAWTEQTGNKTASEVTVKLEKTRRSYPTDWLFVGEVEVWGTLL